MSRWLQFVLAGALLTTVAFAQETRSSVSLNMTGVFNKTSSSESLDQVPTNSAGYLINYRYDLNRHSGVELNYGYSRNTQYFASGSAQVQSGMHETTAAYVFRTSFRKFTPFLSAGGGTLIFNPTNNINNVGGADTQVKAAFLYGGGLDYNLSKNIGLRMQYRGLIYKAPGFGVSGLAPDVVTHSAEPSVGVVFHF